jgi:NADPH:quinone reductase-like Zn-dependent oxidoreductase
MNSAHALPASTRIIVLNRESNGHYSWRLVEKPLPEVDDREILLRVHAVSLQRSDLEALWSLNDPSLEGAFGMGDADRTGQIVGSDAAGEVVAVGRRVKSVKPGDRVTSLYFYDYVDGPLTEKIQRQGRGDYINGIFGDYVIVEETGVAPMPPRLTYEEACTLPAAGLTAWMATLGNELVRSGDTVVIQGTGGVSTFALQFAVAAGAHVIVTSSSNEKLERARKLGAQHGINYKETPHWADRVLELTDGRGADVVIDMGGTSTAAQSVACLKYFKGTVVIVGAVASYNEAIPCVPLLQKNIRAQGVYIGSRADFLRMSSFIEKHDLHPIVARTYPLEQYALGVKDLETGNVTGRVVFRLV